MGGYARETSPACGCLLRAAWQTHQPLEGLVSCLWSGPGDGHLATHTCTPGLDAAVIHRPDLLSTPAEVPEPPRLSAAAPEARGAGGGLQYSKGPGLT